MLRQVFVTRGVRDGSPFDETRRGLDEQFLLIYVDSILFQHEPVDAGRVR